MSEAILKALMQLFAIVSKQDSGVRLIERDYVASFLKQQLTKDAVSAYLKLYENFSGFNESQTEPDLAEKKPRRTSMKDSIRTLSICKQINGTLTQKQKIVVLVRLLELVKSDNNFTEQRKEVMETVSTSFNISEVSTLLLHRFILDDAKQEYNPELIMAVPIHKHETDAENHVHAVVQEEPLLIAHIKNEDLYLIKYRGHNELFLNGLPLNTNNISFLAQGSTIRLPQGALYYSDVVAHFTKENSFEKVSFQATNLEFRFPNGNLALNKINISEGSGNMVALMGSSGAGKTTLLNVLSGIEKPSSGTVFINHIDIHKYPEKIEGIIGYISQDDLLIEELTVYENLYFNAKLCFKNHSDEQLQFEVTKVLSNLGLLEISHLKVGHPLNKKISGGQRKRLNIALELIREPAVLFVDEPTSGLSSNDSENIMDLLKILSLKGKLIFVVIHQPSSDIFKMFDRLFLLDVGGLPIYYGHPIDALIYFKKQSNQINAEVGECHLCGNVNPELLFNLIEARVVDEYGHATDSRKVNPIEWHQLYLKDIPLKNTKQIVKAVQKALHIPNRIKQFQVFVHRDMLSKISNTQYLLINLLEAPVLAFILSFIIRYNATEGLLPYVYRENENIAAYIFMCVIIALFIGLSVSAEEIFKDKKILKREAFLNLSRGSYLFSKISILFSISALQTFLFVIIGNNVLGIKGMFLDYWMVLFTCSCLANMIGLNVSVLFDSAVSIYILIPLLIIPQMVLGGALFSFDKLNYRLGGGIGKEVPATAACMASRWAFEALVVQQFKENNFEKPLFGYEMKESICNYNQAYYLPKLLDKLEQTEALLSKKSPADEQQITHNLWLLRLEFSVLAHKIKTIQFPGMDQLYRDKFNAATAVTARDYLEEVKTYYADAYNIINAKKEQLIARLYPGKAYLENMNLYYNDNLKELVCKDLTKTKIMETPTGLTQVTDAIFKLPAPNDYFGAGTQFFAPEKKLGTGYISTFYFNLLVLWLMVLSFFLILYFDGINKFVKIGRPLVKRSGK